MSRKNAGNSGNTEHQYIQVLKLFAESCEYPSGCYISIHSGRKETFVMCWFSIIGGATNKGIGWVAKACGASDQERKAIEGTLNVIVGCIGAPIDPVGGGILITRGAIQMSRKDNLATDAASVATDVVGTKFHDKALEIAAQSADIFNLF
jgi:hypothetical protein